MSCGSQLRVQCLIISSVPQSPTDSVTVNGKKMSAARKVLTLRAKTSAHFIPKSDFGFSPFVKSRAYDRVTTPNVTTSNLTNHCARCSTCSFEHFVTSVINKGTDNRQLYAYRQLYSICDLRDLSHSLSLSLSLSFSTCYQRFCQ